MKIRATIAAGEVQELHERILRQLDRVGVESHPKVAVRVVELAQRSDAQLRDYGEIIRTDWSLTGRLLRLANSAFFAQRTPVTKLERALVLLGIDRVKAVSLGFYLSRAATGEGARKISRQVWGQSVYRACLATSLARVKCPTMMSEAFVVGLMLDCGVPLMARLLGEEYERLYASAAGPAKLYEAEMNTLEYTHTDVAAALMKRWAMPTMLSKPVVWHHVPPPLSSSAGDSRSMLQRVACYAGAVALDEGGLPRQERPLSVTAENLLQLPPSMLGDVVQNATAEYGMISQVFSEVAEGIENLGGVMESVQHQLVEVLDAEMARSIQRETRGGGQRMEVGGLHIELEPAGAGQVVAYIDTSDGERVISCTLRPFNESAGSLRRMLGLEEASDGEMGELMDWLTRIAA
jgi:HD-like signal output (HDOD) protein